MRCSEVSDRLYNPKILHAARISCHNSETVGVFQLRGRKPSKYCKRLKPRSPGEKKENTVKKSFRRIATILLILGTVATAGFAKGFCEDNNYNGYGDQKFSSQDLRETTIPAAGRLEVDGRQNGGIAVRGENRNDVLIRACVRSWAKSQAEADNIVQTTRIETSPVVRGDGASEKTNSSVSFEIIVPNQMDLKLNAQNGGLKVESVDGSMELRTVNGGIKLESVSGDIKGRTTNGGIKVGLGGNGWTGNGLDVETTNGGIKIDLPSDFAANIETGTVNGSFNSDFPELQIEKKSGDKSSYRRNKRVNASINGGGATVRAVTTNGGVTIMRSN